MLAGPLAAEVFAGLFVFARIGTALSFLPGFGTTWVPVRLRLLLALATTAVVVPVLSGQVPPMPAAPIGLVVLLATEAAIGLFLAAVARIAFAALHVAGTFIAYLASFTTGFIQDPVADQQTATVAGFYTTLGVVLIFVAGFDHLMLRGLVDSYALFPPGLALPLGDLSRSLARIAAGSFALGVQLAAPMLIVSLAYQVGTGLLARLVPQLPVMFFGLPAQLALNLWVMALTISALMLAFLDGFGGLLADVFPG